MTPHHRSTFLAALGGLWLATSTPTLALGKLDYPKSRLEFTGSYNGEPLQGRFQRFSAEVQFDPEAPQQASFSVEIDTTSIDTGDTERDGYLAMGEWFDSETHPKAQYIAKTCESTGTLRWRCPGKLTLKGREADVAIELEWQKEAWQLTGTARLQRSAFAIGEGEWADPETIGDEVDVSFVLGFEK